MNFFQLIHQRKTYVQSNNEPSIFISLLPLMVLSICVALNAFFLAKEKGRNVMMWTVLGAIPLVNFACIWFFVGAANLRTEKKLDEILAELKKNPNDVSQ